MVILLPANAVQEPIQKNKAFGISCLAGLRETKSIAISKFVNNFHTGHGNAPRMLQGNTLVVTAETANPWIVRSRRDV